MSTPDRPPPWLDPRTAYVHVPFCGHHCGYCDFAVAAGRDHLIELYLDALDLELATLGEPRPVESLFVGGGTPTYLSAKQLDRLLAALNRWLPLVGRAESSRHDALKNERVREGNTVAGEGVCAAPLRPYGLTPPPAEMAVRPDGACVLPPYRLTALPLFPSLSWGPPPPGRVCCPLTPLPPYSPMSCLEDSARPTKAEFSIESTPESLDVEKVAVLADHGVNRLSVGVQSFQAHTLRALDRRHGVAHIPRAVEAVRGRIAALSFDLIFAAPGQTPAEWDADLTAALAFAPDHVSTYGLTYEKGTPLWKDRERGRLRPVAEDAELAMYLHGIDRLTAAGFEHYEVSNFARPGRRSVHNQRYWANEAYYGFGVGAARYVGGVRELNVRDTELYVRRVLAGEPPTFQSECLGPRDRAFETVATQLRRLDGIDRPRFREQTGFGLDELLGPELPGLVAEGLLHDDGVSVKLTRRGLSVADGIIEQLMKANTPYQSPERGRLV